MALPKREELPVELTWDITMLYESQESFIADVDIFKEKIATFKKSYEGKLSTAENVTQAILDLNDIMILADWVISYGFLPYSVDRQNPINEQNIGIADELSELLQQETAFFMPEVMKLDATILDEVKQKEEMTRFISYIMDLERQRPTLFDSKTESILGAISGTLYGQEKIFQALKFEDLTFEDFEVDGEVFQNNFPAFEGNYEKHENIEVRHKAWKSFHDGLAKYQNTAAKNYISLVQTHKKMATLRGFDSVFDYLLFGQKVTQESYHQVMDTLMDEWSPVMRRFAKMMKEEHRLEELSLADIKSNFNSTTTPSITIEESREIIQAALAPLGDEYSEIIEHAFEDRWIDYPMAEGKSTGGYCSAPYAKPSFILLNWSGLLNEALVLSHELGHAGHFTLSSKYTERLVAEPSMYFIEAPSTCNEVITCQYLLRQPVENSEKRALIANFVQSTYYHNMVTHLLEAVYQRKVYQAVDNGEMLNTAALNKFFKETLEEFWDDALIINEGAELTWMRQPHYFDGLYPYTYAAGLSIGTQMGKRIADHDQEAIDLWLDVLKMGGEKSPLELAKYAGIDMTTPEPLRQAIAYVTELLDQIEALG